LNYKIKKKQYSLGAKADGLQNTGRDHLPPHAAWRAQKDHLQLQRKSQDQSVPGAHYLMPGQLLMILIKI
jgi:hypothetical protein